jgi:molybdopterin molybdotransferase
MTADADLVIVSGGSSVGQEDYAPMLLDQHGELAIHGIAMRPSSPTGMGLLSGKLIFLLPGNPVSCLCAYDYFAGRAIRQLGGRSADWPYARCRLPLARKLVSQVGRVDYARARIVNDHVEPISISGASILTSTTTADGFVILPTDSEGHPAGAEVDVYLYDS